MSGPNPNKRLSRRYETIQETIHEWVQTLPYPYNQQVAMRENALVQALTLQVELLIEAAFAVTKEDLYSRAEAVAEEYEREPRLIASGAVAGMLREWVGSR